MPSLRTVLVVACLLALSVTGALIAGRWYSSSRITSFQAGGVTYYSYTPAGRAGTAQPISLLALHLLGGNAHTYVQEFVPFADRYGWTVVVPAFDYDKGDDIDKLRAIREVIPSREFPGDRLLVYGFSRGSQMAHRLALLYPERVLAVAAMSAGTYTIPDPDLNWPLGVRDMTGYTGKPFDLEAFRRIPFWVGVGAMDNNPGEVPREWDRAVGTTRLDRAGVFASSLRAVGVAADYRVFPGQGHEESSSSLDSAMAFLADRSRR